jgi:hypothetical protein
MPGELDIMPRSGAGGTGTDFDQSYIVDRVERHVSATSGYTQAWMRTDEVGAVDAVMEGD